MTNKVYLRDCMEWMRELPDKYADFIHIDPPYFQIKGDFDFIMLFDEWKALHEELAEITHRILKDNGSLVLWGHAKKIAYQQVIFDKYFNLLNAVVWKKKDSRTQKCNIDIQRSFIPVTERFLFYDKGEDKSGLTMIYSNPDLFKSIKDYMRGEKEKIKIDYGFKAEKEFNNFINKITDTKSVVSRHYFADSQYIFPTKEIYLKLQFIKKGKYFRREYEDLRREYEDLRRPFNLDKKIKYDVIEWEQESSITGQYDHPTQKPPGLIKRIVQTCCKPGSIVLEPFAGMAPARYACADFGLHYEGTEIDPDYWQAQEDRYKMHIAQPEIFDQEEIQEAIFKQGEL